MKEKMIEFIIKKKEKWKHADVYFQVNRPLEKTDFDWKTYIKLTKNLNKNENGSKH